MVYKVKVQNGALDIQGDAIILRGVIDPESYDALQVARYQRERRSISKLKGMITAIRSGQQLPDIEIGIRGENYSERNNIFYIEDDCFIVDGLQRLTACQRAIAEDPKMVIRLGCMFHFNTTEKWEKDRFKAVNGGEGGGRVAVSPNILLRNSADECQTVSALIKMSTNDKDFVLRNKISWGQNKGRGELVTALTVMKTIGHLHSHFGPGRSSKYQELMRACDKTHAIIGANTWRANVREFFGLLDNSFGITKIAYADLSQHIKFGFLRTLAQLLADHSTFWEGTKLKIDRRDEEKLRQFPINDPGITALIGSGGGINPLLYQRMVAHFNSGRRINRLVKWNGQVADGILALSVTMEVDEDPSENSDFQDSSANEVVTA